MPAIIDKNDERKERGSVVARDIPGFFEIARSEVRHHSDRLLGMGLFWAWLQIIFSSPACTPTEFLPIPFQPLHQIWTISLFFTILIFLYVLIMRNKINSFTNTATLVISPTFMALGASCLVLSFYNTGIPFTTVAGIILIGFGSGMAFLLWGEHLAVLEPRRVLFDMAIYSFLTAILFGVVIILPASAVQSAVIIFPLLSTALLKRSHSRTQAPKLRKQSQKQGSFFQGKFWLIGLAVLVGLVYGIMRGTSLFFTPSSLADMTIATVIGIAIAGLFLVITIIFFKRESEFYLVCQISFPLLAGGFLLLPRFSDSFPLPIVIFTIGHSYFYFLLWVFCVGQSQRKGRSAVVVFAVGLLAFLGSSLIGSIASDLMFITGSESSQVITIISIIVVYLFIILLVFALRKTRKTNDAQIKEQEIESFESSCARAAQEGGLSPRETEVFRLLAEGKDRADIRELLHISNDTVKTHARRIYAKLDIHSKKEARALVESYQERDQRGMNT